MCCCRGETPSQDTRMVSFYPVNSNGHKSTMSALINLQKGFQNNRNPTAFYYSLY